MKITKNWQQLDLTQRVDALMTYIIFSIFLAIACLIFDIAIFLRQEWMIIISFLLIPIAVYNLYRMNKTQRKIEEKQIKEKREKQYPEIKITKAL